MTGKRYRYDAVTTSQCDCDDCHLVRATLMWRADRFLWAVRIWYLARLVNVLFRGWLFTERIEAVADVWAAMTCEDLQSFQDELLSRGMRLPYQESMEYLHKKLGPMSQIIQKNSPL